jgi:hypothetical protein
MIEKKREPPPRPRIKRREEGEQPSSKGGEIRHTTMEVQADWLENDDPPPPPKPTPRRPSKGNLPKPPPPHAAAPKASAGEKPAPARGVPRPSSAKDKRPSGPKISEPEIRFRNEPPPLPPPPATVVRARGKLPPSLPREDEKDSVPPPRPRPPRPSPR